MTWDRENILQQTLVPALSNLFYVERSVKGIHPVTEQAVEIDLLIRPKEKTIRKMGLEDKAIGIEVKDWIDKKPVKKFLDCLMQTYSYSQSLFGPNNIQPSMMLVYPDLSYFFQHSSLKPEFYGWNDALQIGGKQMLRKIMQRANIGELVFDPKGCYKFMFEAGAFFHSQYGRTKVEGLGLNRYVGSKKLRQ